MKTVKLFDGYVDRIEDEWIPELLRSHGPRTRRRTLWLRDKYQTVFVMDYQIENKINWHTIKEGSYVQLWYNPKKEKLTVNVYGDKMEKKDFEKGREWAQWVLERSKKGEA